MMPLKRKHRLDIIEGAAIIRFNEELKGWELPAGKIEMRRGRATAYAKRLNYMIVKG